MEIHMKTTLGAPSEIINQLNPEAVWVSRNDMPQVSKSRGRGQHSTRTPGGSNREPGPIVSTLANPAEIAENKWFRSALRYGLSRLYPTADRRYVLAYRFPGGRWSYWPQHARISLQDHSFVFRVRRETDSDRNHEMTKLRKVLDILSRAGKPATGVLIGLEFSRDLTPIPQLIEAAIQSPHSGSILEYKIGRESMLRYADEYKPFKVFAPYLNSASPTGSDAQDDLVRGLIQANPKFVNRIRAFFGFAPNGA